MVHTISFDLGEHTLSLETGKVAKQANGSAWLTCEDTVLLATATSQMTTQVKPLSFLALTVHYQEKFYATGRIPGGYGKRQGKRTDSEILTARRTDRSIRPMFDTTFRSEVDVVVEALSASSHIAPQSLSILAASTALMISDLPYAQPVGAVRVIRKNETHSLYFGSKTPQNVELDLFIAATESDLLMVEGTTQFLSEEDILQAVLFAQNAIQPMLKAQNELRAKVQKEQLRLSHPVEHKYTEAKHYIQSSYSDSVLFTQTHYTKRDQYRKTQQSAFLETRPEIQKEEARRSFIKAEKEYILHHTIEQDIRLDQRSYNELRPIACEIDLLPRVHGSALFTRGETQALVTTTLGSNEDEQNQETIYGQQRKHFYLHYNFPAYATGQNGRFGIWGRRELGHGHLAEQALRPALPSKFTFPYTINVVSEITEANGSSSMATVCGATLSMLASGVPLKESIAGTSIALFQQDGKNVLLSDPLGEEDYLGDMDLKVCGGREGITALHMDLKIQGISIELFKDAMLQAKCDRQKILDQMNACVAEAHPVSQYAPQIVVWTIPTQLAKDLLGGGGKKLRKLKEETQSKIIVHTSGSIRISAPNQKSLQQAAAYLNKLDKTFQSPLEIQPKTSEELTVGESYSGIINHIKEYGAFIRLDSGQVGLLHKSEWFPKQPHIELNKYAQTGQRIQVRLIQIDEKGRLGFSVLPASANTKPAQEPS